MATKKPGTAVVPWKEELAAAAKKAAAAEKNSGGGSILQKIGVAVERVQSEAEKRLVAQLLTLMDGLVSRGQVTVIGATNMPDLVDPAGEAGDEIRLPEVPWADVDGEVQRPALRFLPGNQSAGFRHDPEIELHDQVGFLGDRDESSWRQQATLRMLPAYQRLRADPAAARASPRPGWRAGTVPRQPGRPRWAVPAAPSRRP